MSISYEEYVEHRLPDSLDDGAPYDDGVNDYYLGDPDEDYPYGELDCE